MPFIPDNEQRNTVPEQRGFIPDAGLAAYKGFIPEEKPPVGSLSQRLYGAGVKGMHSMAGALLQAPSVLIEQTGLIRQWSFAEDVLREQDPKRKKELRKMMSASSKAFTNLATETRKTADLHKHGQEVILRNHPEWESEPPESFKDLVLHPSKLAVSLAEATPLLLGAGILTAAGQPNLAATIMYTAEGQEAYQQAIVNGESRETASIAYGVYGSVAAVLERMQLEGIIKVAKGSYNALLNRTAQKIVKGGKGLRAASWITIKTSAQEALEEMSQGTWGEVTAKIVYDKDIPGDVVDFIDRRAQEAYVAAAMGLIPGVTGGVTGVTRGGSPLPITQQGTEAVSEAKHQWTKEEIDTTFGQGINEALEKIQTGEVSVDEIVEMSELQEIEERKIQGLPNISEQTVDYNEYEKRLSDAATELMKEGVPQERAWNWAKKQIELELEETKGAEEIVVEREDVTITPEKGKLEFYERKKFETPKTTVVKELAKLVNLGLSIDDAVATLQDLRTSKTQEVTHKDQTHIEVEEIAEAIKQANPEAFADKVIGSRGSKLQEAKGAVKDSVTHFHWKHMRIGRMLEWLDGKQDGPLKEYIWKPMRAAVAKSAMGRAYRVKQLHDVLEEFGIRVKELYGSPIEIREGLSLRPVDMLEVFLATKDKEKLRNLKEGNGFTDEDIQDTLAAFIQDERMLHLGHWLLGQYSADYNEVAEKYNKTTGEELPSIPGYSAIRRLPEGKFARFVRADQDFDDLIPQLMGALEIKKKGVSKGMTMTRTHATGPLNLDAMSNYIAHTRAVEHYKAMALPVYNVNQMINNHNFRQAVQSKTKGIGNHILSKWLQDVASERTSLENDWVSRTLGVLRRNAVVSALGLNIVTAMKQPLSLALAAADDPKMIPGIMSAFAEGARSPSALKKFVHDRSVVVRHRNMEREVREMARRRSVRKQIGGQRSWSERSLMLIRTMDQATVQVVWKAAYDMKMQTQTEEQAIAYADSVIERTQPMADIMDLPHFFRGSELHKMFTLFQNQINQNYNYWAHDIVGATKRGEISKEMLAYRVLMSTILPATFLGLIGRGFSPPDDIKEWMKDMASFMVAPIFMFGRVASAILNGYDPSSIVGLGWTKELVKAERSKGIGKKATHIALAAAKAGGIPTSQPVRTIKGLIALNEMETDDPRRLIWSQYALQGDKPKKGRLRRSRKRRTQ